MSKLGRDDAIKKLKLNNVQDNVIEHCSAVSLLATEIAKKIQSKGHVVDVDFVEVAALLHDIGRAKTHGIDHGVEGAKILQDFPEYARICECHLGGGIKKDEAEKLGLPSEDYLPETLEEKIICYADKLIERNKRITLDESLKKFAERLGPDHPTIERIKKLDKEIQDLL
jgi:uncharacterized protein